MRILMNDLRHALRALQRSPGFLVITVGTLALAIGSVVAMFSVAMERLVQRSLAPLSFTMMLLIFVATLALLLGAVGLYGVLSQLVAQRTREIGVRMALGATAGRVQQMIVSQGVRILLVGIVVGCVLAFASTRVLEALLFGVSTVDPWMFGAMASFLLAVGMAASWIPARQASLVDPLVAMRGE